jgi:hypothetical protein
MIRPFRSETERYGEYSKAGEFVYDHPFLWGSKRTGPDLHRVGGKYPDAWHYNHMEIQNPPRPARSCRLSVAADAEAGHQRRCRRASGRCARSASHDQT